MDDGKLSTVRTKTIHQSFQIPWKIEEAKSKIVSHLECTLAREPQSANLYDWMLANCYSIREKILAHFIKTQRLQHNQNVRRVYYLSMEYLMGRLLRENLNNCGMLEVDSQALADLGMAFEDIENQENDFGLGNGGLGRLAACFLDSLATLNYPAVGYGMYYEFGLFRQKFANFQQREMADNWAIFGNPWQIIRPENVQHVKLYGRVEEHFDENGNRIHDWVDTTTVMGVPWDIPVVGYGAASVNFLRLWESRASEEFNFDRFNRGDYLEAIQEKVRNENISKVLYPNDSCDGGKELRLIQQYFLVACSLKDIIRRHFSSGNGWENFAEKVCIQLNDTHPTIAIVELMRILLDEGHLEWDRAWQITTSTFAFANHTLLPEALEKWSVDLFRRVLPRHLQLIYEINGRFLAEVVEKRWPGDDQKKRELSLIEEGTPQYIRMAYLAVVGSFSVNGVAAMHSELVKQILFPGFHELWPEKFNNKTNGVTPRRWIKSANPRLASLLNDTIGTGWVTHLEDLRGLEPFARDRNFRDEFARIKHENKRSLARLIEERCAIVVDPTAIFDVQIKRIHEYKRQHLNLLHILTLYRRLLNGEDRDFVPRVFIFGGKAAPGYFMAKTIIHAINLVADRINHCDRIGGQIKVAFIPNYDVSTAMKIIPAADLSEQISTAGTEASGTGNMKLAMNGALTIGTLDGATVEMREEIGDENMFIFGNRTSDLADLVAGNYTPRDYYEKDPELRTVLDWMQSDVFDLDGETNPVRKIAEHLLNDGDPFFVLADFRAYVTAQEQVSACYLDRDRWMEKAILNVARMGKFSSDRTIREYAEEIWKIRPMRTR